MYGAAALKSYRKNSVTTIEDPHKIVKLLFEAAIRELGLVKTHFDEPRKRGTHLGKAIAIVGELQAGVNLEKGGEAAQFLYGLYGAIIRELSKVNGSERDLETIDRSIRYLSELRRIWVEQVLEGNAKTTAPSRPEEGEEKLAVAG